MVFCYIDAPLEVAEKTGLMPTTGAGNVYLCSPLDPIAFERTWVDEDVRFAALTQVAPTASPAPIACRPKERRCSSGWRQTKARGASMPDPAAPDPLSSPLVGVSHGDPP
jgi:hypothetical protein